MSQLPNLIAVVCFGYFVYRGYRSGFVHALFGILSLILGYIAMFMFSRPVGQFMVDKQWLSEMAAYSVGSIIVFIIVQFIVGLIANQVHDSIAPLFRGKVSGKLYKSGGALMGGLTGAFYTMMTLRGRA